MNNGSLNKKARPRQEGQAALITRRRLNDEAKPGRHGPHSAWALVGAAAADVIFLFEVDAGKPAWCNYAGAANFEACIGGLNDA